MAGASALNAIAPSRRACLSLRQRPHPRTTRNDDPRHRRATRVVNRPRRLLLIPPPPPRTSRPQCKTLATSRPASLDRISLPPLRCPPTSMPSLEVVACPSRPRSDPPRRRDITRLPRPAAVRRALPPRARRRRRRGNDDDLPRKRSGLSVPSGRRGASRVVGRWRGRVRRNLWRATCRVR